MDIQYTEQAKSAVKYAEKNRPQISAHNYIGTEASACRTGTRGTRDRGDGSAGSGSQRRKKLMELIDRFIAPSGEVMTISVQGYTPRAERLLAESVQEAENFHSTRVGTEHLLLAMLRMGDCVGTRLLHTMGR